MAIIDQCAHAEMPCLLIYPLGVRLERKREGGREGGKKRKRKRKRHRETGIVAIMVFNCCHLNYYNDHIIIIILIIYIHVHVIIILSGAHIIEFPLKVYSITIQQHNIIITKTILYDTRKIANT